jgi:hypothetical protein
MWLFDILMHKYNLDDMPIALVLQFQFKWLRMRNERRRIKILGIKQICKQV